MARAGYIILGVRDLRSIAYDIAEKPIRILNHSQDVYAISILLQTRVLLILPARGLTLDDPGGVIMAQLEVYQYREQPRPTEGPPPRIPFQRREEFLAYLGIYSRKEASVFFTLRVVCVAVLDAFVISLVPFVNNVRNLCHVSRIGGSAYLPPAVFR